MGKSGTVLLGPWGGEGGNEWSYTPIGEISNIFMTYDSNGINSIRFTSKDARGRTFHSDEYGTAHGPEKEITIDSKVEKLISIEGSVGIQNSVKMVTSLGFTTSKTKHEPVGNGVKDSEFSCLLTDDPFAGFHGRANSVLNSIGISVEVKAWVGPWPASSGGSEWDYVPKTEISHIFITYDDYSVHSLSFASKDANGDLEKSPIYGVADGSKHRNIEINTRVEKLVGIRGAYGPWSAGGTLLKSLSFITNNSRSFGPFGIERDMDTSFSYLGQGEEPITGFHGRAGQLIDSIGVYSHSNKSSVLVGPFTRTPSSVGTSWTYQPKGLISRIFLTHYGAVNTLQFESTDEKGNKHTSEVFGSSRGKHEYTIDIDEDDKLTNISSSLMGASYGPVLNGLCISTEKKDVYGPFDIKGYEKPNVFSFPIKDGYISGFHGRSDSHLRAIGVFVKPI